MCISINRNSKKYIWQNKIDFRKFLSAEVPNSRIEVLRVVIGHFIETNRAIDQ